MVLPVIASEAKPSMFPLPRERRFGRASSAAASDPRARYRRSKDDQGQAEGPSASVRSYNSGENGGSLYPNRWDALFLGVYPLITRALKPAYSCSEIFPAAFNRSSLSISSAGL